MGEHELNKHVKRAASDAVSESVERNIIAHFKAPRVEALQALRALGMEDWVDANGVVEAWGTHEGETWRVEFVPT